MIRLADSKGMQQRARGVWLAKGHDTKFCIVAEGATLGLRYSATMRHDMALGAATRKAARARQGLGSRYKFCIVIGRGLRHGFVSRYNARHGRGGLRYDAQQCARAHYDTARDTAGRML